MPRGRAVRFLAGFRPAACSAKLTMASDGMTLGLTRGPVIWRSDPQAALLLVEDSLTLARRSASASGWFRRRTYQPR
jgi:hypothetical protein